MCYNDELSIMEEKVMTLLRECESHPEPPLPPGIAEFDLYGELGPVDDPDEVQQVIATILSEVAEGRALDRALYQTLHEAIEDYAVQYDWIRNKYLELRRAWSRMLRARARV